MCRTLSYGMELWKTQPQTTMSIDDTFNIKDTVIISLRHKHEER